MKSYNGNINGFQKQLSIYHQNVQGITMSLPDQISCVETIISKLCPDVLILSEADSENICNWSYPGYVAHKGKLLGQTLARVSISFILNGKQHRITGVYRE